MNKEEIGCGIITICEYDEYFLITSGNPATHDDAKIALDKCELINSYSAEELRQYKRKQMQLPKGKKGTGNAGLIKVAIISKNKISCKISSVDNQTSLVKVEVKIKK
jgi:hypothetical protein